MALEHRLVRNFGRNVAFQPAHFYRPAHEREVLEILARHPGAPLRCRGALHSWSPLVATTGVLLDLGAFDKVEVLPGDSAVRVGAGCALKKLLTELRRRNLTLPTLGVIKRQTIAGATATGTHGSGRPSVSHFIARVRLAHLDAQGRPTVSVIDSGDELLAARCSLGAMGVLLELDLVVVPRYRVEEEISRCASLEDVIAGLRDSGRPLTWFALIPWSWTCLVYRRRVSSADGGWLRLKAWICRLWLIFTIDFAMHALLVALLRIARRSGAAVRAFFHILPRLVMATRRVDDSVNILTLHHDWFTHVEMELFVPLARLPMALAQLRELVEVAGHEGRACSAELAAAVQAVGMRGDVDDLQGRYTLHYPLVVRRVENDDTLISMASVGADSGDWASIGIFTFQAIDKGYEQFCRTTARCMIKLHGARLHWGKYFPIALEDAAGAYPRFGKFQEICRSYDPKQQFRY